MAMKSDSDSPSYRDKFYEIRQLLTSFKTHMKSIFLAGWKETSKGIDS